MRFRRHVLSGLAGALWLLGAAAIAAEPEDGAPPEPPASSLRWDGDRLAVHATRVPLDELLQEIADRYGADVAGDLATPRDVSVEFDPVPLDDALRRLLGDQSFALVYGADGRLRQVRLLPTGQAVSPAPTPVRVNPLMAGDSPEQRLGRVLDAHLPVPVEGRLAQLLGSDGASVRQLVRVALTQADASLRVEAMNVLSTLLDTDARFRMDVVAAVDACDDASLRAFLAGGSAERVREALAFLVTHVRAPDARQRAAKLRGLVGAG
jgi:hypothetical protein